MENLAHSASFQSGEKSAPSNPGTKHFGQAPEAGKLSDKLGVTANPAYVAWGSEGRETGMHPVRTLC